MLRNVTFKYKFISHKEINQVWFLFPLLEVVDSVSQVAAEANGVADPKVRPSVDKWRWAVLPICQIGGAN